MATAHRCPVACLWIAVCGRKLICLVPIEHWQSAQQRCPHIKRKLCTHNCFGGAIPTLTSAGHVPNNLFMTLKAEAFLISLAGVERIAVWVRRQDCPLDCIAFPIGVGGSNNFNGPSWPWLALRARLWAKNHFLINTEVKVGVFLLASGTAWLLPLCRCYVCVKLPSW